MKVRFSITRVALSAAVIAAGVAMAPRSTLFAQAPPVFEVSPAVTTGHERGVHISVTPERLAFDTSLVTDIIAFAYALPEDRVERRPQWTYDNRYNVAVNTSGPATLPEQRRMLQKLLEQRFGLAAHLIEIASPVYYLVRGPEVKLTPAKEPVGAPQFGAGALQPGADGSQIAPGTIYAKNVSMSDLAAWLYTQMKLPVLDKTGITGSFDIEMRERGRPSAESMTAAVRKALGLDLEVHRGTAESLIIDHVEQPSGN